MGWDDDESGRRRQQMCEVMSAQSARLEEALPLIRQGARARVEHERLGDVVWQFAAKDAEFGHAIADGYRDGRYSAIAAPS